MASAADQVRIFLLIFMTGDFYSSAHATVKLSKSLIVFAEYLRILQIAAETAGGLACGGPASTYVRAP
jgi:hypothetical protein